MGITITPTPFHAVSATDSSSGEKLIADVPCGNVAFIPQQTVLQKFLQLLWVPSISCDYPSNKPLQHGPPSESQPSSGLPPCSSVGYSMGCRWDYTPLLISMGCKGSACHLTTDWRGITAPACLPTSFLPDLYVRVVVFSCLTKRKRAPKIEGNCSKSFPS